MWRDPMAVVRKLLTISAFAAAFVAATNVVADDFSRPYMVTPAEVKFSAPAATAGVTSAVIIGDPKGSGIFVTRIRIPPNFKIQPHSHPDSFRSITVLSGTYYFAYGDVFDDSKLQALGAGSIYTEPTNLPHFARTGAEEVILQITAQGPTGTNPVQK
jgi:quercetin dioxygenase-like cupin family protein